jgi:hypothetical protein
VFLFRVPSCTHCRFWHQFKRPSPAGCPSVWVYSRCRRHRHSGDNPYGVWAWQRGMWSGFFPGTHSPEYYRSTSATCCQDAVLRSPYKLGNKEEAFCVRCSSVTIWACSRSDQGHLTVRSRSAHLPAYLPTYLVTYLPNYLIIYLPTYLLTYILTHLSTYLPTYLHTYTVIYLLT